MSWFVGVGVFLVCLVGAVAGLGAVLPRDHVASRSIRLDASREAVWQAITDHPNAPSWRTALQAVERGADDGGHAVWREIDHRGDALPLATVEEMPPTRLVRRIADPTLPFGGTWTYDLADEGPGCRITITEHGEVRHVIYRFVSRFVLGHTATIDAYLGDLGRKFGASAAPE